MDSLDDINGTPEQRFWRAQAMRAEKGTWSPEKLQAAYPQVGGDPKASPNGGLKADAGKPAMELLPWDALVPVARVLGFGAQKYAPENWRGLAPHRVQGAMLRHLAAHAQGERTDPESGESHLAHAACNALFLLALVLSSDPS